MGFGYNYTTTVIPTRNLPKKNTKNQSFPSRQKEVQRNNSVCFKHNKKHLEIISIQLAKILLIQL